MKQLEVFLERIGKRVHTYRPQVFKRKNVAQTLY